MGKMKDAAPGEDGVRLCYLRKGGERVMEEVVRIVQFMWKSLYFSPTTHVIPGSDSSFFLKWMNQDNICLGFFPLVL